MRNNYFFLILAAALFLTNCKKEEQTDNQLPEITFTGFAANDTLRNTVSANFTGQDNKGISKVEVYANDSLIASTSGTVLSLKWNTLTVKDGNYKIKSVVTDNSGNKKELITNVVVSNALVTFDTPSLFTSANALTLIVTDTEGAILNTYVYAPGGTSPFSIYPKTAFDGEGIHLIRIEKSGMTTIECYANIKRGTYFKAGNTPKQFKYPDFKGPVPVTFANLPSYDYITVSSERSYTKLPVVYGASNNLIYTESGKVLVQVEKNNSTNYHLFDITQDVPEITLDAALCTTPSLKKSISLPSSVQGLVFLSGNPYKDFADFYTLEINRPFNGNKVDVFYPDMGLGDFLTTISYNRNGMDYLYTNYSGIIPDRINFMDADAVVQGKTLPAFNVNFSGNFDYYQVVYQNKTTSDATDPEYMNIVIYGNASLKQFTFPDITKAVTIPGFNLSDFKLNVVRMYDLGTGNDSSGFFNLDNKYYPERLAGEVQIASKEY